MRYQYTAREEAFLFLKHHMRRNTKILAKREKLVGRFCVYYKKPAVKSLWVTNEQWKIRGVR